MAGTSVERIRRGWRARSGDRFERWTMHSACRTDVGLVRDNNEDFVLADEANGIFMLADGMGGGPAGEVASELAVTAGHALLLRELCAGREVSGRLLADALAAAHAAVAKRALAQRALRGMGCTLEVVVVRGGEATLCHVGDSRVYLFRRGSLRQLTDDDNYASWLARTEGVPYQRIPAMYRHVLTRAVGVSDEPTPEIATLRLEPGDLLLMCSDGLSGVVSDSGIAEILAQKGKGLDSVAESLVAAANGKGGPDNVSVIVLEPVADATAAAVLLPAP